MEHYYFIFFFGEFIKYAQPITMTNKSIFLGFDISENLKNKNIFT